MEMRDGSRGPLGLLAKRNAVYGVNAGQGPCIIRGAMGAAWIRGDGLEIGRVQRRGSGFRDETFCQRRFSRISQAVKP
jgi:hypothetical protein